MEARDWFSKHSGVRVCSFSMAGSSGQHITGMMEISEEGLFEAGTAKPTGARYYGRVLWPNGGQVSSEFFGPADTWQGIQGKQSDWLVAHNASVFDSHSAVFMMGQAPAATGKNVSGGTDMVDRSKVLEKLARLMVQHTSYVNRAPSHEILRDLRAVGFKMSGFTLRDIIKSRPKETLKDLCITNAGMWLGSLDEAKQGKATRQAKAPAARKAATRGGGVRVPVSVEEPQAAPIVDVAALREEIEKHRDARITICFGRRAICDGRYKLDVVARVLDVLEG